MATRTRMPEARLPRPTAASTTLRATQVAARAASEHNGAAAGGGALPRVELHMNKHTRAQGSALRAIHPLSARASLRTAPIDGGWPTSTSTLCLHCAEAIRGTPLPVARYWDAHARVYWAQGFFCRPCCALAFVRDGGGDDVQRATAWTREVLAAHFGCEPLTAAPPRTALAKFGGPLGLPEFYGEDAARTRFVTAHAPPMVSYSMYLDLVKGDGGGSAAAGGVARPTVRTSAVARPTPTGKPPLLVEYLATLPAAAGPSKAPPHEKRRREPEAAEAAAQSGGSLSRFLMRK